MEQREHSMWGRRTGEVCRRPEPAAIYKRKHGPRSGLPVLPAGPTWHLPPVLLGWVRPPACPLRHRDKGCALSDRTEPVPQAVSPFLCSGLRAWHLLQRRVQPVCAVHAGDLPGRGRPAQLHTVPQQRRARPGRGPQRVPMWRRVWAEPGERPGWARGIWWLHRGALSKGPEPGGTRHGSVPSPSPSAPPAAALTPRCGRPAPTGPERRREHVPRALCKGFTVHKRGVGHRPTCVCDGGTKRVTLCAARHHHGTCFKERACPWAGTGPHRTSQCAL